MFFQQSVKHSKIGLLISMILLFASLGIIAHAYVTKGEILSKGIDFTGGSQIAMTVDNLQHRKEIETGLTALGTHVSVKFVETAPPTILVESKEELPLDQVKAIVEGQAILKDLSSRQLGAALGQQFLKDAYLGLLLGFVGMSIVVFITFRSLVPSLAVILAGVSDIAASVAFMNVFHIDLTLITLAGLLTLIGYSVDTDILLSTRVLKRRSIGTLDERIVSSFKTGITMTLAAIAAMLVLFIVSKSPELDSIALVILFGLVADMPFTWLQNVAILKMYCKKKGIE